MPRRRWKPPILDRQATPEQTSVPSWIVSICFHGTLMLFVAVGLQSCDSGANGASDEEFREVGIYIKDAVDLVENVQEDEKPVQDVEENTETDAQPSEAEIAEAVANTAELPSELLDLPELSTTNVIGAAAAPLSPPSSLGLPDALAGVDGAPAPSVRRGAGHGRTSFFDIDTEGNRFLYVVDQSGSMGFYGQLRVARSELQASLQSLDSTQQFHIIFYNTRYREMQLRNREPGLSWATDINRTLAGQFLRGVSPEGGTDHIPALRKALSYRPEHLFFLTDADQPQLTARDLDAIQRLNRGRTHIHCIEFGQGANLGLDNFLKRLARQNDGTYRYRDVTKFGAK
jgi:Ca-activated chloride channel family protein